MVIDSVLGELGPLTNVYELPQQSVGEFTYKNKSVLFPIREEFIDKVDRTEMKFYVTLPEGLVDIYLTDDKKQKQE
jgi:16S rRNA processing protein RimM